MGPNLIVLPRVIVLTWNDQLNLVTPKLSILHYYAERKTGVGQIDFLSSDVVLTTYNAVVTEFLALEQWETGSQAYVQGRRDNDGSLQLTRLSIPLLATNWDRIVLDEAHVIRNSNVSTSKEVCILQGTKRIACTGTPCRTNTPTLCPFTNFSASTLGPTHDFFVSISIESPSIRH